MMIIRNMFAEDINRQINGVIKVDQSGDDIIEQEIREYVITKELKKHFITFFNYYSDAFEQPTADMGVWISGFFGSGKSHFLKILSYLLENKVVNGKTALQYFEEDGKYGFKDADGKPILKKGKLQPVKGATDSEIIPLNEDIDTYMKKNVLPFNALAFVDRTKDKIGYEIPFTRIFYKFVVPASSADIFEEIKTLEAEETILMKELFGNA